MREAGRVRGSHFRMKWIWTRPFQHRKFGHLALRLVTPITEIDLQVSFPDHLEWDQRPSGSLFLLPSAEDSDYIGETERTEASRGMLGCDVVVGFSFMMYQSRRELARAHCLGAHRIIRKSLALSKSSWGPYLPFMLTTRFA